MEVDDYQKTLVPVPPKARSGPANRVDLVNAARQSVGMPVKADPTKRERVPLKVENPSEVVDIDDEDMVGDMAEPSQVAKAPRRATGSKTLV